MPTYLVRWPNGLLSIATADDIKDLSLELAKDEVCTEKEWDNREWDSPHGMIIEMPKGFRVHLKFTDDVDLLVHPLSRDATPTLERLYPHLTAVMKVSYKTKKGGWQRRKRRWRKSGRGSSEDGTNGAAHTPPHMTPTRRHRTRPRLPLVSFGL